MPYRVKGKCIYKKDGGAKVGCTKGSVKKYLAALHANASEGLLNDPILETQINESTKDLIKRLVRESFGLFTKDETPDTITYDILSDNEPVGVIVTGKPKRNFGEDAIQLIAISIKNGETNLQVAGKAIEELFEKFSNINRIIIQPKQVSVDFWTKLGAQRIDSDYMVILRGH